jgi:hypothetical protein
MWQQSTDNVKVSTIPLEGLFHITFIKTVPLSMTATRNNLTIQQWPTRLSKNMHMPVRNIKLAAREYTENDVASRL